MLEPTESSSGLYSPNSGGRTILSGYLQKVDIRAMGLISRRRYWFALSDTSNYLYWFKDHDEITCIARLSLRGAAFNYNPVEKGRFEIHAGTDVYNLEAPCNKTRDEWLEALQNARKHCQPEPTIAEDTSDIISLSSNQDEAEEEKDEPQAVDGGNRSGSVTESCQELIDNYLGPRSSSSQETLNEDQDQGDTPPGPSSFCVPMGDYHNQEQLSLTPSSTFYLNTDGELNEKSMEMPDVPAGFAESVMRKLSVKTGDNGPLRVLAKTRKTLMPSKDCENCKKRDSELESLEERCHDLEDHVASLENMVKALKGGLLTAQRQLETMKAMQNFESDADMRDFLLVKEQQMTKLQLENNGLNRKIQVLEADNREMENRITVLDSSVEAFRDCVRTKEELIMRLIAENTMLLSGDKSMKPPIEHLIGDVEVPEAILIDQESITRCDEEAQQAFEAVGVRDINEMKDLVEGYRAQNKFLSNEVIGLHGEVQNLINSETDLIKKKYNVEACYYQMKSRYIMVLNHFKSPETPGKIVEPGVLRQLLVEANRAPQSTPGAPQNATDTLGFYLRGRTEEPPNDEDLLEVAGRLMKKANGIVSARNLEQSEGYMLWLQSWDALLVNFVGRPLIQSQELKNLVRTGVPPAYRKRVWKGLVSIIVKEKITELGSGYYSSMLRKAKAKKEEGTFDSAIKQIDLDLVRTLPTNKNFDDPGSLKIDMLRNVLYAFRYHNVLVGYCQGLNRLAAIALLYLEEEDAFWFMVACVEHLQPEGYYTSTLIGAVADQRVLRDLVGDKLPKFSAHLKSMEVDLSLFTLSWFLTSFVDILPHSVYLSIFDVFLYEGNKALFRFALALLKLCEPVVLQSKTIGTVHASLSRVAECVTDFKGLAQIAFNDLNPFPQKMIDSKRAQYRTQLKGQGYA